MNVKYDEIEFLYESDLKDMLKNDVFVFNDTFEDVKGLTLSTGRILINLSAYQWKHVPQDILIQGISNTITHELGHKLTQLECLNTNFSRKAEEQLIQQFVGQ